MKSLKRLLNKAISPLSEKNKRDIVVQARLLIEFFSIELVLVLEVSCGGLFCHSFTKRQIYEHLVRLSSHICNKSIATKMIRVIIVNNHLQFTSRRTTIIRNWSIRYTLIPS